MTWFEPPLEPTKKFSFDPVTGKLIEVSDYHDELSQLLEEMLGEDPPNETTDVLTTEPLDN